MAHNISSVNGRVTVFDITAFLSHAHRLSAHTRPLVKLARTVYAIISWRCPKITFIIWFLINTATVIIPTGYSLMLFILLLMLVTALGVLHHHTHIFEKIFPDGELDASALQPHMKSSWGNEKEILQEYRQVLVQIDEILVMMNGTLEHLYDVLKWEKPILSMGVTVTFGVCASLLYFNDLSVVIFALNNLVLLGGGVYWQKSRLSPNVIKASVVIGELKVELEPVSDCDNVKLGTFESEDDDLLIRHEEDRHSVGTVETKQSEESSTAGKYRTNVVRKLMELRRRSGQLAGRSSTQ